MDDIDIVWIDVTVTCEADGCPNKDKAITVTAAVGGNIICGPCSTELVQEVTK